MIRSAKWDGRTITAAGIYSDMPLADYHRGDICDGPSVSSSGLRKLWNESPAHYWDTSPLNPNRADDPVPEHFITGRAAHHVVCGQAFFASEFIIRPGEYEDEKTGELKRWHNGSLVCKRWNTAAAKSGKTIITPEQTETIRGMAVKLGECSLMQQGILNGLIERSIFWRDKETGLWLKARPDAIPSDSGDYADLKTTQSVLYLDLMRTLEDFNYEMQGALVMEGAKAIGLEASTFSLVFVEKKRPYCVRVCTLEPDDIARGTKMNRVALRTLAHCLSANHWPGPGDDRADAETLMLSQRARERIDERIRYELREAA